MRQLGWGLGILLGSLLAGLLTMPEWLPGVIHRQAQHWAEETHHRLEIGSLKVEIFPFRIQAHGVRLYEADGQTLVLGLEDLETSLDLKARIRPFSSELRGEGDLSVQGLDLAPWIPSCSVSPGALTTHFAFWGPNWGALQRKLSGLRLSVPQIKGRVAGLEILLQDVQLSAPSVRYNGGAVNFGVIHLMGHDGQIRPVGVSEAAFPSLPLSKLEGTVEKLAWPVSVRTPLPLWLALQVGAQGRLQIAGPVDLRAQGAHLTVHAQHLDLRPVQPWLARYAQVRLESGQLSLEGVLDGSFSSPQVWQVRYRGQAQADELAVREGRRGQWLWRSKTLFTQGEATLNPLRLRLDQVALSDFYVRLHLLPDATLNWVNLLNPLPVSSPSVPKSAGSSPPESSSVVAQAAVVIRKVTLQGGTIHYRDDYVHPPYKANLTRLGGKIEGLSSAENTTARLELRGRVHDAPLLIEGQINPLAQNLFLDMTAQVTGMDLMQFSPYSGKYVGYDIERGKLSFDAHYSVRNHDLQATNHLVLNELTFGKPVASPGITHFPVALAVSLLQDPQGRIMVNLPIAGSLDDPQFSVGGVLARTLVQVLEKAVESIFVH
ncbi:MAG: DUF748 domain-containing protein [Ferrovum myxofaciens]|uniref:DUF748 domain-containing protein n=1 Tax=Ferrovum myxofaciens TaxID=416213 RepID=UPI0023579B67|nr:DUF748 domain-containing protein [Ferrovum myxofaciens]QKE40691.1 MAG: DUF748 domain-containing protein [Ferrovum myxofaciens]